MPTEDLVAVCAGGGDTEVWLEFVRRFHGVIAGVVLRTARRYTNPAPSLVEDLVQDTYLKLCLNRSSLLRNFESQHAGSVFGLMKVVAANVVHDHFKITLASKRGSGQGIDSLDEQRYAAPPGHAGSHGQIEREILLKQIDRILQDSLSGNDRDRDRAIFWLYYRQGLTANAIASIPHVKLSEKGVHSAIGRLTQIVKEELCRKASDHNKP
jgi:RNA polymerase sigma-70 factor (ECF subfamily)